MSRALARLPFWWVLFVVVLQVESTGAAEISVVPPPNRPDMDRLKWSQTSPPVTGVMVGELEVTFERTTLSEVRESVGVGVIQHRGDAGDSEAWLCYTLSSAGQTERLWISSSELGGSERVVGNFYAVIEDQAQSSANCPELPERFRPVSLDNSLWLDSSVSLLEERLGKPSAQNEGWWFYLYSGKVQSSSFDLTSTFAVHISNGKITRLYASQTTTN